MSTNYSSSLVPNCIQQSQSPVHQNNDIQRNTNRTPVNTTNHSPGGNSNNTTTTSQTKSNQQLKSPVAKRPANASVTLQGWLHKQGSDGLQLWRKRWFVLSELCLYYYKSTEEDKLLGSVLLPSYRVSECRPEDKVVRKFAFKLEHANMRTYLLAADSHKSMLQWVCALNLACMLQLPINNPQKNIESPATPQQQSHNSQKIQNNQKQQSTTGASASTPNHFQPLYENAPPKPRRVSESVRYMDPQQYGMDYPHQKYSHIIYANQHIDPRMQHHMTTSPSPQQQQYQHVIAEQRRTPDTYGRSMSMSHYDHGMVGMRAVGIQQKIHHPDYEDVYNVKSDLYEPPRSPLAYNHIKNDCPNLQSMRQFQQPPRNYRPINIEPSYRPHNMEYRRQPVREVISRPHSVDFLEHNNSDYNQKTQPERPKSSLDINQYNDENDFYSEQDYANKMRQSSIYLQYRPIKPNEFKSPTPMAPVDMNQWYRQQQQHQHAQQQHAQQQAQQDIYEQRHEQRPHAAYLHPNTSSLHRDPQLQHHYMQHAAAVARDQMEHVYGTSPHHMSAPQYGSMGHPIRSRSKSPQVRIRQQTNMGSESMPSVETEKKREESMKRLIEWKQRMLQSPLNHKQKSRRKCHEMQRYESESPSNSEHINSITQHRSSINNSIGSGVIASSTPTNTASRYHNHRPIPLASASSVPNTSYSSDDEASGSVSIVSGHDGQSMEHPQSAWLLQPDQGRRTPIRSIPSTSTYQIASPQFYDENDRYPCRAGSLPRNSHYAAQNKRRQSYQKATMTSQDENQKLENIQRLEQLKLQILDLGKRYEKNKPLVNLVDNMVKLGSLYQKNGNSRNEKLNGARNRERLQFNQQVQERRLLAEEKRDWKKINLNHAQLQSKIQQLYELDNALRHESGTLAGLRKEKEYLEGALQSLQNKLTDSELPSTPPAELDRVRRHQQLLERELSRVHVLLAYNSKKLEETVAGNARIEQELLVLRQKLQMTQRQRKQPYLSNTIPKERKSLAESAPEMESELKRVQWLMGDLQKQRQELSVQVRHLTDKSQNLAHQMQWPISNNTSIDNTNDLEASTSSLRSSSARSHSPSSLKRTQWLETDLDICSENKPQNYLHNSDDGLFSTDLSENPQSNLYEKQEIKTVRIVKRESERRHRDRERTGIGSTLSLAIPPARLATMGTGSGGASSMSMGSLKQRDHGISSNDLASHYYKDEDLEQSSNISSHVLSKSTDSLATYNKKPCGNPLSPPLQTASLGRRIVPKEKRRHHTAPDNNHISRDLSLLSASDGDTSSWLKSERSLDDLDMERALRPRINTPDVVRSTLGHKEIKYNERTIDNILGTPSKIIIPERYMPQDLPELSAEEERQRMRKVESIKKMLSDSTALPTTLDTSRLGQGTEGKSFTMSEEKRQREHLLQLNQILAKQVIEMSKIVAEKALNSLPQIPAPPLDEDELSPITPLPLYQQRENFYS